MKKNGVIKMGKTEIQQDDEKVSVHVSSLFKKLWQLKFAKKNQVLGKRETQGSYFEKCVVYYMKREEPKLWEDIQHVLGMDSARESQEEFGHNSSSNHESINMANNAKQQNDDDAFDDDFDKQRGMVAQYLSRSEKDMTRPLS